MSAAFGSSSVMQVNEDDEQFSEDSLAQLARRWLRDIRQSPDGPSDSGELVVAMNFDASPEIQWRFILIAVSQSQSDVELSHIAAGPLEHLLSWHGENYIDVIESEVAKNVKFARALTGVWQHMMTDEVWSRVERLQKGVSQALRQ